MAANKYGDKWESQFYYKDYTGKRIKVHKRGFKTKKEALEYEREQINTLSGSMNQKMDSFVELYLKNIGPNLKERSLVTKKGTIERHILPYFADKEISEITAADVIAWQNTLKASNKYSDAYLRHITVQFRAIINHAVKIYDLKKNPCKMVEKMGSYKKTDLNYWTKQEYDVFIDTFKKGTMHYTLFEILFWTGMRLGELLALTKDDIDLDAKKIAITKTYYRKGRTDVITTPKTEKSIRKIRIPDFLVDEIKEYYDHLYDYPDNERLFPICHKAVENLLSRHIDKTNLPKIRVHDLRHSHCAYLISIGTPPAEIRDRLGHQHFNITMDTYGHLYPDKEESLVDKFKK